MERLLLLRRIGEEGPKLGQGFDPDLFRFAMRALWKRIGGGISRIDLYDNRLHGLPYIAERLGCSASDIGSGSMAYESAKHGAARSVLMLSKSVEKVILKNHYRDSLTLAKLQTDGNVQHVVG